MAIVVVTVEEPDNLKTVTILARAVSSRRRKGKRRHSTKGIVIEYYEGFYYDSITCTSISSCLSCLSYHLLAISNVSVSLRIHSRGFQMIFTSAEEKHGT
jgi:hypothetical protein